jgi:hypothetical protein
MAIGLVQEPSIRCCTQPRAKGLFACHRTARWQIPTQGLPGDSTPEAVAIVRATAAQGVGLHCFGFKTDGLAGLSAP